MVQLFVQSLLSWLVASSQTSTTVLSCSENSITIASGSSLKVGDIFVHVDSESAQLCREDCSVLFRRILRGDGNGVYQTAPASFAQVFPPETYDHSHQNTPVETVLPSCDESKLLFQLTEAQTGRRYLQSSTSPTAEAPAPAPLISLETVDALVASEARKDHYEDDDDDDDDDDKYADHPKKEGCDGRAC